MIFIDPSFVEASRYSIVVSPGVGNALPSAPVPEPGAVGLAVLGLGALVCAAARRQGCQRE
jgi:hypothetical protein